MSNIDIQPRVNLEKVERLIQNSAKIFSDLGYTQEAIVSPSEDRQIVYENQIFIDNSALSLTVVALREGEEVRSQTFNFEYRNLPGNPSRVKLQDREVKSVKIQLVETEKYKMLSMQLYFVIPLNYTSEDLIFRVRMDKSPTGPKVKLGFPWLEPKLHMSEDAALEITEQISAISKPDAV